MIKKPNQQLKPIADAPADFFVMRDKNNEIHD